MRTCYFGNFCHAWLFPTKIIVWICRKLPCLSVCEESTSLITSFLRYYKEIEILLFQVIWTCLKHTPKMRVSIWRNLWCLSGGKKWTSFLQVFLEILHRYCKLVILGSFGMPGYTCLKWWYQLVENLCIYQHAKNQRHLRFSGDICCRSGEIYCISFIMCDYHIWSLSFFQNIIDVPRFFFGQASTYTKPMKAWPWLALSRKIQNLYLQML